MNERMMTVKVGGRRGMLYWSARGIWSLTLGGYSDYEEVADREKQRLTGVFTQESVEAAKQILLARARERKRSGESDPI